MSHADFVHLNCHTQYSLLDSTCKIEPLLKRAMDLKFPAIAMTDNGNMFGTVEFYSQAMKKGIKPIIGMSAYVAPGSRFEKQTHGIKEASFHLTLLAKSETGYKNLMKLTSAGYLEGFYYRPRIDKEILQQHSEGLIALSGSIKGEIPYYTRNEQPHEAKRAIQEYLDIFGKENFYFEAMDHGLEPQKRIIAQYLKWSKEYGIKLVATNECRYIYRKDARAHDALICIGTGSAIDEANRLRYQGDDYFLKSADEMKELFKDVPGAIKTTLEIAERCNVELDFKTTHLPYFEPPKGKKQEEYLKELCNEGLQKRMESQVSE